MIIEHKWAMPSRNTFAIKPIHEFVKEEVDPENLWIDPFAGIFTPARITNDLNPDIHATYHLDAIDFLRKFEDDSVDGVIYDPPYSARQVSECYKNYGNGITWDGRSTFFSNIKDEIARILIKGGKCICFGWNSNGISKSRGFEMTRLLIVAHGGWHNDTICTSEYKL